MAIVDLRLSGFAPQLASQYPQSEFPSCVLNTQVWTSFEMPKEMIRIGHAILGRLAHGSCQVTSAVCDVEGLQVLKYITEPTIAWYSKFSGSLYSTLPCYDDSPARV